MSNQVVRTPDEADFQEWIRALNLKIATIRADITYDDATSFCTDCPKYEESSDFNCCKETGKWAEQYEPAFEYIDKLILAQKALKALLEDGS